MMHRRCPLCDADRPILVATITAGRICTANSTYAPDALAILGASATDEYPIVRCAQCGFVYAQHAPSAELLRALYERVILVSAAREESQAPAWVGHQLGLAEKLLSRLGTEERVRILDYGCGYGSIVRALSGPRISCVGYEYAESVAREAQAAGLDVVTSVEEVEKRAPFDGIILSDVLEHLESPRTTLETCARLLRLNGWICVNVPDFGDRRAASIFADLRRGALVTPEVNPWEHLNYFSPATLAQMLECAGYTVDPYATATPGLHAAANPVRRWGNGVKAALRVLRFAASPRATSTTIVAQRRGDHGRQK